MNWDLYLLSVGNINNFKLSLAPVELLLWCWINYWSSPLFLWFCPTNMTPVFSISLVGIIPSLVCIYMIIYTWCGRLNFYLCIPICVDGIHIYVLASLKTPFKEVKKTVQMCLMASLLLGNLYKCVCSYYFFSRWTRSYVSMRLKYFPYLVLSMNLFFHRAYFFCAMTMSVSRRIYCSCLFNASDEMIRFLFVLCWNKGQANDESVTKPWSNR